MIDTTRILSIAIEAGALIATLAAIAAAAIMSSGHPKIRHRHFGQRI